MKVQGKSMLAFSRDIGTQHKTTVVLGDTSLAVYLCGLRLFLPAPEEFGGEQNAANGYRTFNSSSNQRRRRAVIVIALAVMAIALVVVFTSIVPARQCRNCQEAKRDR
jgi:hypothetical protein